MKRYASVFGEEEIEWYCFQGRSPFPWIQAISSLSRSSFFDYYMNQLQPIVVTVVPGTSSVPFLIPANYRIPTDPSTFLQMLYVSKWIFHHNRSSSLVMPLHPPRGPTTIGGHNFLLASILALLSYVPFEWVAKGSLILCAFLFIVDPIPPISRLLALISLLVVYGLTKLKNHHQHELDLVASTVIISDPVPSTNHNENDPSSHHSYDQTIQEKVD